MELRMKAKPAAGGATTAPAAIRLPTIGPLLSPLLDRIPPFHETYPRGPEGALPWPVDMTLGEQLAATSDLMRCDLLGRLRDPRRAIPGALLDQPLDGTAVRIDPRRRRR